MDVDFSELDRLAADFDDVPAKSGPFIAKAVEVSARKVRDHARESVRSRRYFKGGARAISYDLVGFQGFGSTVLDAEIGYDRGMNAGRLGRLIEFGAPNARAFMTVQDKRGKLKSVPVPGNRRRPLPPGSELQKALAAVREDFVQGLEKALNDGLAASIRAGAA